MTPRVWLPLAAGFGILLTGCGLGEFNEGRCRNSIEASPVRLDGEQVMITPQQIDCGFRNDLWDQATYDENQRGVARIQPAGRALHFDDDVQINDPAFPRPYVQIRGEFPLQVLEIVNIRDSDDPSVKLIEVKLGIMVNHTCFQQPIPLAGVKRGRFNADMNPIVRLRQDGSTWIVDRMMH
jgi:hypothetical protein